MKIRNRPAQMQLPAARFDLRAVTRMIDARQFGPAYQALHERLALYPRDRQALELLLEISTELQDSIDLWRAAWLLVQMQSNEYYTAAIAIASIQNQLAFAAGYYARQHLKRWPGSPNAEQMRRVLDTVEPVRAAIVQESPFMADAPENVLVANDEITMMMTVGLWTEAEKLARQMVQRAPAFVPMRNNQVTVLNLRGKVDEALRQARAVLTDHPDNFFARANLCEALLRSGDRAAALAEATSLLHLKDLRFDHLIKRIEMLALVGADDALTGLYQSTRANREVWNQLPGQMRHLFAVSLARTGETTRAKRLWTEIINESPSLAIAQDNRVDIDLPPGERSGPWPFDLNRWLPRDWLEKLAHTIEKGIARGSTQRAVERFVAEHPMIAHLAPLLFERGDPLARETLLHFCEFVPLPGLKEFVLGQDGMDEERLAASRFAVEHGLLPRGESVMLYREGTPIELHLYNYEVYTEPEPHGLDSITQSLFEQSHEAFREGEQAKALDLAEQAYARKPQDARLNYHLGIMLRLNNRPEEGWQRIEESARLDPNYLFARCALSERASHQGDTAAAEEWLAPVMRIARLHVSEHRAMAFAQIELALAKKAYDSAQSWLSQAEEIEPDHPSLMDMQMRIALERIAEEGFGWRRGRKRAKKKE